MHIQRQRRARCIAVDGIPLVVLLRQLLIELQRRRVGRVARPAAVVAADQVRIEYYGRFVSHGFDGL